MSGRLLLAVFLLAGCDPTEPSPEPPPACGEGLLQDSDGTCVPLGCGLGTWGALEHDADTLHVAPGGAGSGSEQAPFGTLGDALGAAAAQGGGHIVLAAGSWSGDWILDSAQGDLRIEGRCAELVSLDAGDSEAAVIQIAAGTQLLRGLTLRGGGAGLVVNRTFGAGTIRATVQDVIVQSPRRSGILLMTGAAELDLVDVQVRDVQATDGARGVGFGASSGGVARLTRGTIERAATFGVEAADPGTEVYLVGTRVLGTRRGTADLGVGIASLSGALLRAEGVELLDSGNVGALVDEARLELVDVLVEGTGTDAGPTAIGGVEVLEGGVLSAERLRVGPGHEVGVLVAGSGARASLIDPQLSGGLPRPDANPELNVGLSLVEDGWAEVVGGRIDGWLAGGLAVAFGAQVELEGVQLSGNGHARESGIGGAIGVLDGGRATLRQVTVEDSIGGGVVVSSSGGPSSLVAEDLVVRGTRAGGGGGRSAGIALGGLAQMDATGLELIDNAWVGLLVQGPQAQATLLDSRLSEGRASEAGEAGYGVVVAAGGSATLERVTLDGLREAGALAWGAGSTLVAEQLVVPSLQRGTDGGTGAAIAATGGAQVWLAGLVASDLPGPALVAYGGGRIDASDAVISGCEFAGAAVYGGGALALTDSVVTDSLRSPRDGGGIGVFADSSEVRLEASSLSGLRGPALYARGVGRFELADVQVERAGQEGGLPGAVLAVDVPIWDEVVGLSLRDLELSDLPGDGVVLHGSGARLDSIVVQGVAGEPLYVQACEGDEPPVVLASPALDSSCRPWWREIDPPLRFELELVEIDVQ